MKEKVKQNNDNRERIGKGNPPKHTRFSKDNQPPRDKVGRKKKIPELEELLIENMTEEKDGLMAIDLVIKQLRKRAIQGDMKAIEYLINRVYGKMKEQIEHKGEIKTEAVRTIGSKDWIAQMKADGYSNEEIIKVIESA